MAAKNKFKDIPTSEPGIFSRAFKLRTNISNNCKTKRVTLDFPLTKENLGKAKQMKNLIEQDLKLKIITFDEVNSQLAKNYLNNNFKSTQNLIIRQNIQHHNESINICEKTDTTALIEDLLINQLENYKSRISEKGYQKGKISSTTFDDYTRYVNYTMPFFKNIRIGALKKIDIINFIDNHKGRNIDTILDYLIPLKSIVKFQHQVDNIERNIFDDNFIREYAVQVLNDDKKKSKPYQELELEIIKNAPNSPIKFITLFGIYSGMRIGELIALRWYNVRYKDMKIFVTLQFTRKRFKRLKSETSRRVLEITPEMFEILDYLYKKPNRNEFIFLDPDNSSMHWLSSTKVNEHLSRFHASLGIPHRSFHNTRKTFARKDLDHGKSITSTAKKLGHKSPQETYDSYLEITQDGFDGYVDENISHLKFEEE